MHLELPRHNRVHDLWKVGLICLVLACFVFAGVVRANDEDGDDLSTSFIGCRLIATGQASHLYAHDPNSFAEIGPDTPWQEAADRGAYKAYLHPYVQTPLWAWALQPLCKQLQDFSAFQHLFALCSLLSFATCIWLVAKFWAPTLYSPWAIATICIVVWFAEPFRYSLALMQTHILFVMLTIAALILAERNQPVAAGSLLAVAATVKITPGVLLLYWLLTRRWKAAASMAIASVFLLGASYLAVGPQVMERYFATLERVSHVLLLSQNNQSFSAWLLERMHPKDEVLGFHTFVLPRWVGLMSGALLILFTLFGGLLDRRSDIYKRRTVLPTETPLGAMIALVAATIFAPISWSHYSIVLIAPLMILLDGQLRQIKSRQHELHLPVGLSPGNVWMFGLVLVTIGLNIQPFAAGAVETTIHSLTLIRSHFYAECLCLLLLASAAIRHQKRHLQ